MMSRSPWLDARSPAGEAKSGQVGVRGGAH